ncbi:MULTISPECIES: outer membrane protein transport protein [Psychrobacter]|uniref:outer membrane protein transport protein n=1 Tax=Psychrobacter TaxID=497 RepID=UPI000434EE19|nr:MULTISPECIES: outer membrane protein transport protein [Psychrobacter]WLG14698.1 outer membrane protein transport protein [Psychrobacter cibarius]GAF62533.1 outer membrane protein E [Psychrobacter sp. JCM 18903]
MRANFHLKTLTVAVAALSIASVASAAGLDRSGQDITAFLQDGTYAESVYTYIDADVSGKDLSGNKLNDIAESYDFFRYGVKADINDTFSIGILYDEPFGAAADYNGQNDFVTDSDRDAIIQDFTKNPNITEAYVDNVLIPQLQGALAPGNPGGLTAEQLQAAQGQLIGLEAAKGLAAVAGEATQVEVRTESITGILGAKFGANKEFQAYGGPVAQRVKADVKLRGDAYSSAKGYTTHISNDQDYGWIAGMAYSKPEIALKAALTYRSEIKHNAKAFETFPIATAAGATAGLALPTTRHSDIEINTPESVNFDFQTGINPTMLATAKVRWVPWSDFAIVPSLYNDVSKVSTKDDEGLALVSYDEDQWQVELGLAKRMTPALAVTGTVGWDSGAGNPVTSLGPIEGYYSAGLGAKYNVTENWAVSAGGKYLWFGDAKGQIPTKAVVSNFEDNDGFALGVKLSYQAN